MPDYGSILRRSWEIIKKNKWLLVYGLVLASIGAGGGGSLSSGSSVSPNLKDLFKEIPEDLPDKTSQVLGVFTNAFKEWLGSVSPATWLLLILGVFLAFLIGLVIRQVILSWTKGSLISGVRLAEQDQAVSLANTSPSGIAALKNLILFSLMVLGFTIILLVAIPALWFVGYFLFEGIAGLKVIWIILGAFCFLAFFFVIILFSMISIYAERLIVFQGLSPWEAWKKGFSLSKKGFLPTIVMGILNSILSFSIGCLSLIVLLIFLAIPAIIFVIPAVKSGNFFSAPTILGLGFIFFIFINANLLVRAIIVVFKFANWNQLFEEIVKQEKANVS